MISMTEYYCGTCKETVVNEQDVVIGQCPWCREERVIHKKCGTRIFAVKI